jgi:beta-lactamase superfamily II metal-dependent hydrolase
MVVANLKVDLNGLIIPHHGGHGNSTIPTAATSGQAAVSYGVPNKYKHPNEIRLRAHTHNSWNVIRTAKQPTTGRGNRWLYQPTDLEESVLRLSQVQI